MLIFVLFLVGELKICFFQTTTLGFSDKEVVKEGDTCLLNVYKRFVDSKFETDHLKQLLERQVFK